jgi:hypothetical protein
VVILVTSATGDSMSLLGTARGGGGGGGRWLECGVGLESRMATPGSRKVAESSVEVTLFASLRDWQTGVRAVSRSSNLQ